MDNMKRLVSDVNKDIEESNRTQKMISNGQQDTSNDMFKVALANFVTRQTASIEELSDSEAIIEGANNTIIMKLLDCIEEDSLEVADLMRFSDMMSKQKSTLSRDKTNRLATLVELLKPTKDSQNALLNNERSEDESSDATSGLSSQELQAVLKLTQYMSQAPSKNNEEVE